MLKNVPGTEAETVVAVYDRRHFVDSRKDRRSQTAATVVFFLSLADRYWV